MDTITITDTVLPPCGGYNVYIYICVFIGAWGLFKKSYLKETPCVFLYNKPSVNLYLKNGGFLSRSAISYDNESVQSGVEYININYTCVNYGCTDLL